MKNKENNNSSFVKESVSKSCRVDETLSDTLNRVFLQIDFDTFDKDLIPIAKELALVIAEVFRLPENSYIRIDGSEHFVKDVAEVFRMIEKEHIEYVILKNDQRKYPVKYRKAYLRTLLYNSVFEYSSAHIEDL